MSECGGIWIIEFSTDGGTAWHILQQDGIKLNHSTAVKRVQRLQSFATSLNCDNPRSGCLFRTQEYVPSATLPTTGWASVEP